MLFEPINYGTKLKIINPEATIAVITLWSKIDTIYSRLANAGVDMSKQTSKVAVMGNLYGEGFRYLLRNLLYNPQIDTLVILGRNSSGSAKTVANFFALGVEPVEHDIKYKGSTENIGAVKVYGTNHIMDDLVLPGTFWREITVMPFNFLSMSNGVFKQAAEYINEHQPSQYSGPRLRIEVPEVEVNHFPSNVRDHTIVDRLPSEAWRRLVHRVFRFGREVDLPKGKRRELQNVKVVIEHPMYELDEIIASCGFDPDAFQQYQYAMMDEELPADKTYTYGHRIRSYFGLDCLNAVLNNLRNGLDARRCYITTWDNTTDITGDSRPCLASLFFRKDGKTLYLTATFRTHNASSAWYENVYGLMAYQWHVAHMLRLDIGALTIISHSISLDPSYMEKAQIIHDEVAKTNVERRDPNGHFTITIDGDEIVVAHWSGSSIINEYRARRPEKIQHMMYRDCAISDINHALYIGRQLEKASQSIKDGTPFIEA